MHLMTSKNSFFCSWVTSGLSATRGNKGPGGDAGRPKWEAREGWGSGDLARGVVVLG